MLALPRPRLLISVLVIAGVMVAFGAGSPASAVAAADLVVQWGDPSDVPLVGDVDADGRADLIVWRPSLGRFFVAESSRGYSRTSPLIVSWGVSGDVPFVADVDADGRVDFGTYRPSEGIFYVTMSTHGYALSPSLVIHGPDLSNKSGFRILTSDVDGDRRPDIALYEPNADGQGNSQFIVFTSTTSYDGTFARQAPWGLNGDSPLEMNISTAASHDLATYRPGTNSAFGLSNTAGLPIQRVMDWRRISDSPGRYAYAPEIIKQGNTLYSFQCSLSVRGPGDNTSVMTSTDNGLTWSTPHMVLFSNGFTHYAVDDSSPPDDPHSPPKKINYEGNHSKCDPSIVHYQGFYYLYSGNTLIDEANDSDYTGYVTVSRLPETLPLDSPNEAWQSYTEQNTWETNPPNMKGLVFPRKFYSKEPYPYGAGQQSLMVVDGKLVMYFVDDSRSPNTFHMSVNNCWTVWRMTATDPVAWDQNSAVQTNTCGHSPVVKFDTVRNRYVLVRIANGHNADAHLEAQYSPASDGVHFSTPVDVLPSYVLPNFSHNVGIEGNEFGQFVPGENPLVAWGGIANYDIPIGSSDAGPGAPLSAGGPWDLYGARVDVLSGNPPNPATRLIQAGSVNSVALTGDVDHDGRDDLAVFDPGAAHTWGFSESSKNYTGDNVVADFGNPGDIPFLAHFNPAGTGSDLAVWKPSSGVWSIAYANQALHSPTVSVPNIAGMTQSDAISALSGAGLTTGQISSIPVNEPLDAGKVILQTPGAGATAAFGAAVNFSIGVWNGNHL